MGEDSTSTEEQGGCKFICFKDKDKGEGECDLSLGYSGGKLGRSPRQEKKKDGPFPLLDPLPQTINVGGTSA